MSIFNNLCLIWHHGKIQTYDNYMVFNIKSINIYFSEFFATYEFLSNKQIPHKKFR